MLHVRICAHCAAPKVGFDSYRHMNVSHTVSLCHSVCACVCVLESGACVCTRCPPNSSCVCHTYRAHAIVAVTLHLRVGHQAAMCVCVWEAEHAWNVHTCSPQLRYIHATLTPTVPHSSFSPPTSVQRQRAGGNNPNAFYCMLCQVTHAHRRTHTHANCTWNNISEMLLIAFWVLTHTHA